VGYEVDRLKHHSEQMYKDQIELQAEVDAIEASLDDGGTLPGTEPWNIQSQQIKLLIADPSLSNIEEDNSI